MDETTGCAMLCQVTGGTLAPHNMAGSNMPVLLRVHLSQLKELRLEQTQKFLKVVHGVPDLAGGT